MSALLGRRRETPATPSSDAMNPASPGPGGPGSAVLRLEGVTAGRRGQPVVSGVDLTVRPGEVTAIVGPNGAGKSTLLHTAAGDLRPLAGAVLLDDQPLSRTSPLEAARRRAVLPQSTTVAFPFSVGEVVAMARHPWRGTPAGDRDREAIDDALRQCGLEDMADRPATKLSGGEWARVALAKALAQTVPVLLLDEPIASLDPARGNDVLSLLRSRARAGDAVAVVLHDLTAAAGHADRIVVVAAGGLLADGPVEQVVTAEILSEAYAAPMDVIHHPTTGAPIVLPGPTKDR